MQVIHLRVQQANLESITEIEFSALTTTIDSTITTKLSPSTTSTTAIEKSATATKLSP